MQKKLNRITFFYEDTSAESEIMDAFFSTVQNNLQSIEDFFGKGYPQVPIYLVNKLELDNFVKNTSMQYKNREVPRWLVGFTTSENIHILTPTLQKVNEMSKVALHEMVHFIIYKMGLEQPPLKVLDEGLAEYLSQKDNKNAFNVIAKEYLENNLKKLSDLCTQDSIKFAELKGYQYSYYVAEFLILNYGKTEYIEWLKNPNSFISRLSNMEDEFEKYVIQKITTVLKK